MTTVLVPNELVGIMTFMVAPDGRLLLICTVSVYISILPTIPVLDSNPTALNGTDEAVTYNPSSS